MGVIKMTGKYESLDKLTYILLIICMFCSRYTT